MAKLHLIPIVVIHKCAMIRHTLLFMLKLLLNLCKSLHFNMLAKSIIISLRRKNNLNHIHGNENQPTLPHPPRVSKTATEAMMENVGNRSAKSISRY